MSAPRTVFRRTLRVVYPIRKGRITLRTEQDWNHDIEPDSPPDGGHSLAHGGAVFADTLRWLWGPQA